jgi:hypothetical protein
MIVLNIEQSNKNETGGGAGVKRLVGSYRD